MKALIQWFTNNSVAVNVLMCFLVIAGFLSLGRMNAEILPQIDPRIISVRVDYPGATPADVENAITRRLEEAILGLEGIDRVRSSATEGVGSVTVELDDFANAQMVRDNVDAVVNRLKDFPPENAEEPEISIATAISPVARLIVVGNVDEHALKDAGEDLERGLLAQDGISIATLQGARLDEISIEVEQNTLEQYGIDMDQIATAIRLESVNLSAGSVRTPAGDILLRTNTEARDAAALSDIVVLSDNDGRRVKLGDIAVIRDHFDEDPLLNTYNGQPAVFIQIERSADEDSYAVRDALLAYLDRYQPPPGIEVILTADVTETISDRINLLTRNAILGLALVFVFLALTLDLRLAFWTSVGIPVAFMGGALLFSQFVTINMTALMGLILVLGIVVDDAIVVGENIFDAQSRGETGPAASIAGAAGVLAPVTIGVVTSMIAFSTLLQLTGVMGQLLSPVSIVVLSVLAISLVEVFLILPEHLAHGGKWSSGAMKRLTERVQGRIYRLRDKIVMPIVERCIRLPYAVIASCVAMLLVLLGLLSGGHVRFVFFPEIEGDSVTLSLEMPAGTPFEQTSEVMDRITDAAFESIGGRDSSEYRSLSVTVGGRLASGFSAQGTIQQPELAVASMELAPSGQRSLSSSEIERRWRNATGDIAGIKSLTFESAGLGGGDDISLNLSHADTEVLEKAVSELVVALSAFEGVSEIQTSNDTGKRQIEFELTPAGVAAGLTVTELTRQVRAAYFGEEVQRFQRDSEEVKVFVRFPVDERQRLSDLTTMRIRLPGGSEAPLAIVAQVKESRGYTSIDRIDGVRVVTVSADVDEAVVTSASVRASLVDQVLPALEASHYALEITSDGQTRSQAEELDSLVQNFLIAVFVIYLLLASILRSYWQPLIIVAVIPFGLVGAVVGHLLLGHDLTFLSLFGVVALSGVIINDSIVLMDYYNRLQKVSDDRRSNILDAVRRRFRPILLTTLTTFIGLLPMIFETSMQARFLIPMALSLAFGIVVASIVILMLVPALLAITPVRALRQRVDTDLNRHGINVDATVRTER